MQPARAVLTRTDGPALNGALAGTGALLGVFSLPVSAGLLIALRRARHVHADRCSEELEVIPYSLPFREPYVTARGELERAESCSWSGFAARGSRASARPPRSPCEAAPASRRSRPRSASAAGRRCSMAGVEPGGSGRRSPAAATAAHRPQALAAVDIALHDLVGRAPGDPVWRLLGATRPRPVRLQRDPAGGQPGGDADDGARTGARRASGPSSSRSAWPGDVTQVATVRETLGPRGARSGSTPTAPGASTDAAERLTRARPVTTSSSPSSRSAPSSRWSSCAGGSRCGSRPTRASSPPSTPAARRELGACEVAAVKVAKVGGLGAALEIAEVIPSYLSSALEGPVGIAAGSPRRAGAARRGRRRRGRPRTRHRAALLGVDRAAGSTAERRSADRSTSAPGWASRSTKRRLRRGARLIYASAAWWIRPTATRRSPPRWPRSSRAPASSAP